MFGDEPYGNYNRIMLSHVLSGEEADADIFLNSLPWYLENDITLHAGVRATRIDRFAKLVYAVHGADGSTSCTPYERNANGIARAADVLPLHLSLAGRRVVVVGAGPVAARKVSAWVQAGADVLVVAPYACEDIVAAAAAELLTCGSGNSGPVISMAPGWSVRPPATGAPTRRWRSTRRRSARSASAPMTPPPAAHGARQSSAVTTW